MHGFPSMIAGSLTIRFVAIDSETYSNLRSPAASALNGQRKAGEVPLPCSQRNGRLRYSHHDVVERQAAMGPRPTSRESTIVMQRSDIIRVLCHWPRDRLIELAPTYCVFRTIANTKIGASRTRRSDHREREDRTIANTKIGPS